jgi:hypothetical protein
MNKIFEQVKSTVKYEYFFLSIIIILGFGVRLYKIDNPVADWHSWRQADTAAVSRNYVNEGINLFYPTYDDISSIQSGIDNPTGIRMVEFPVYNAFHSFVYKNFPVFNLEIWGRLLTAFISLLTAMVLFLLGKKHYSSKVGLLTSFFFLFIPFNIYFSRVILPDPLGVLFAVGGLYFFGINNFISVFFYAMAFLQKPYFGIFLIPIFPELLDFKKMKRNILFLLAVSVPLILWRFWTSMHPEGIPFYKWAFNGDRIRFHPAWFKWIFGERLGILILGVGGIVPFTVGIIRKLKNNFALLFLFSSLVYLVIVATANVRHDYYQIMIIPSISLILALGTSWLWKNNQKILLVISLITMFIIGWDRIKPFYQINHPELIEIGNIVDQILPKSAKIVIPYNGDTAFLYQTKRKGWPAVDDSIENIIKRGATHYVSLDLASLDTLNFSKRYKTLYKDDKFIILDLREEIKQ